MFLLNYQAELDAKRALASWREELTINIRNSASFEAAAIACESLCLIARTPEHYLGLELIHVLDYPDNFHSGDISALIAAFLRRIQIQIDHERDMDPTGEKNKHVYN